MDVDEAADAETVGAMREPFVRVPLWKAGIVTDAPRRFLLGQHDVATEEPLEREDGFEIMHVPFRSGHELVKRAVVYEPRRDHRPGAPAVALLRSGVVTRQRSLPLPTATKR